MKHSIVKVVAHHDNTEDDRESVESLYVQQPSRSLCSDLMGRASFRSKPSHVAARFRSMWHSRTVLYGMLPSSPLQAELALAPLLLLTVTGYVLYGCAAGASSCNVCQPGSYSSSSGAVNLVGEGTVCMLDPVPGILHQESPMSCVNLFTSLKCHNLPGDNERLGVRESSGRAGEGGMVRWHNLG